jgi:glycine betaine/proline transport system ATP-binding protein
MLLIAGTKFPLAVIEEETGKLLGLISQTSLIIERFEEKEISELKNVQTKCNMEIN